MSNALVTGASRGLGLEFVKQLAVLSKAGNIFALCRDPSNAKNLNEFVESHKNVHVIKADMTDFNGYKDIVKDLEQHISNGGLNLLINNAGIMLKDTVTSVSVENTIDTFKINAVAPLIFTKSLIPLLKTANNQSSFGSSGKSLVLNISAQLGSIQENNIGGYVSYRLSKAALNMATKTLAVELKPLDVFVLAIHPGWVKTDMGGAKAPMTAQDSVKAMLQTAFQATEEQRGGFLGYNGRKVLW